MAKKNILVDIDFNQNQLLNPVLQNLPEDPSTGVEGQKYFNTTNHIERIYRNGAWQNSSDEYVLPAASTNTRGGVKVGSHLNVTNTDVLNADEASTTQKGVVEIATDEEVTTGTDTERVVTPHGLDIVTEPIKGDIEDLQEGNFNGDWRTPTKDEWNYLIKTRSASTVSGTPNARFIAAKVNSVNGLIILPDIFTLPSGITMSYINNTSPNYSRNIYTLEQWVLLNTAGCIFLPVTGERYGTNVWYISEKGYYWSSIQNSNVYSWYFYFGSSQPIDVTCYAQEKFYGCAVRLIKQDDNGIFSISANTKCTIASSNLQYHCLNKEWRFAPNPYDTIGADNANIAEDYNGWIDLFGFGTSGWNSDAVCYQPWSSSTNDADYINHDLTGDYKNADWGYNTKKQLHNVAFSGDYNDLENKPTIPAAQIQADWNQSDNTALDYIKNKPTVPGAGTFIVTLSGTYGNLVSDKTFLEISAAVSSGQSIVIILPSFYGDLRISPVEYQVSSTVIEFYGYRKETAFYDYIEQLPMPYVGASGTRIYFYSNETIVVDLASETVIGFTSYPNNSFRPVATSYLTNTELQTIITNSQLVKGFLYKTTDTNEVYLATSKNTVQEITSIQSDWNQTNTSELDYIKNKPDLTVYKTKQTAVVNPTASGTTLDVIDTITQNENGVITATKKTIQSATETQKGVAELATSAEAITGTDTERIMTPKTVKDAHDSRHWFGTQAQFDALAPDYDPNVIYHVENTEDTGIMLHWTDDVATLASNNLLVAGDMYAKLPTGDTDKRNITNLYMATSSSTYITLWNL